jgi:hypothetical protein
MKNIIKLLQTAHDNLDDAQDKKQVYDALIDDTKTDLLTAIEQLKLFAIPVVMQRSELLLFADYSESDKTSQTTDECVDNYLAQKQ